MDPHLIIRIDTQGGACPYQAEGVLVVNGTEYPFYFRYRMDRAQMYIWEPGYRNEFAESERCLQWRVQTNVTGIQHNGHMEDAEAVGFINRWAEEFLNEHTWYCVECGEEVAVMGEEVKEYFLCPYGECVVCQEDDCWSKHMHRHAHSS